MFKLKQIPHRRQNNGILIKYMPTLLLCRKCSTFSVRFYNYAFRNKAIVLLLLHHLITLLFSLPQSLDACMIVLNTDGVITFVTENITSLLGYLAVSSSNVQEIRSFGFVAQGLLFLSRAHNTLEEECIMLSQNALLFGCHLYWFQFPLYRRGSEAYFLSGFESCPCRQSLRKRVLSGTAVTRISGKRRGVPHCNRYVAGCCLILYVLESITY